jgi:hypothetical protein
MPCSTELDDTRKKYRRNEENKYYSEADTKIKENNLSLYKMRVHI